MSREQEILSFIANAADFVGDIPFAASLRDLIENLNTVPSYLHYDALRMAWGKEEEC